MPHLKYINQIKHHNKAINTVFNLYIFIHFISHINYHTLRAHSFAFSNTKTHRHRWVFHHFITNQLNIPQKHTQHSHSHYSVVHVHINKISIICSLAFPQHSNLPHLDNHIYINILIWINISTLISSFGILIYVNGF